MWVGQAMILGGTSLVGSPPLFFAALTSASEARVYICQLLVGGGIGVVLVTVASVAELKVLDGGIHKDAAAVPVAALTINLAMLAVCTGAVTVGAAMTAGGVNVGAMVIFALVAASAILMGLSEWRFVGKKPTKDDHQDEDDDDDDDDD